MLNLDYQEASTVLAALRMLQEAIESEPETVLEMSHFVDCEPLTTEQIDELCHRINFSYSEQVEPAKRQITADQLRDIIVNADHLELMVVRRKYAEIHTQLAETGYPIDIQVVMAVVDQMASQVLRSKLKKDGALSKGF